MKEVWRKIEDVEGYEVSNMGRVRNKKGYIMRPHRWEGYERIMLKDKIYRVHRLVAKAFLPNENNLPVVNHKDHNRANNCVNNLEWCTVQYNCKYSGRLVSKALKGRHRSKEIIRKICQTKAKNFGYRELPTNIYKMKRKYVFFLRRVDVKLMKSFSTLQEAITYKEQYFKETAL